MVITAYGPDQRPKQPLEEAQIKQREERGQELLSLHKALFQDANEGFGKHNRNYKMDLCTYHMKGICAKGTECSFAHGEEELRARPVNYGNAPPARSKYVEAEIAARFAREKDAEVMSWLKGKRETTGEEGAAFENQWKEWCKLHDLQSLSKTERIKRLHTFKAEWEAGTLPTPSGESLQAPWPGKKSNKSKAPRAAKPRCLEGHEMVDKVCSEVEEFGCDSCGVDITCGGKLFDCRECDYTLCAACGQKATEQKVEAPAAAIEGPEIKAEPAVENLPSHPVQGAPGLTPITSEGPSCPQKHQLTPLVCQQNVEYSCDGCDKDVTCGEILYYCEPCDFSLCHVCGDKPKGDDNEPPEEEDEIFPEAAWQDGIRRVQEKLMKLGGSLKLAAPSITISPELLSECQQRLMASGPSLFAGSNSCKSMTRTCLSEQNLSAVATTLRLGAIFPSELSKADLSRAVMEALLQNQNSLPEGQAACAALLDFVCSVGFAHFVALGVTKSYATEDEGLPPLKAEESEDAARARRVKAQQTKKPTKKWDYSGGARRPDGTETNEQATLRLMNAKGIQLQPKLSAGEVQEALQPKSKAVPKRGPRYFKKDLCVDFENGYCARNTSCGFAHGAEEQQAARELYEIQKKGMPGRFKRDLCYYYESLGYCKNGADCTFAHGNSELEGSKVLVYDRDGVTVHQGPSWEAGPEKAYVKAKSTHKIPNPAGAVKPSRKMI